ncbi:hypothetical protein OIO90_003807 [Microbotryomycetes sp. JL221]|nr:hypothetical protein OIO90_003807 [Microbotryomycetes sp. JL221]
MAAAAAAAATTSGAALGSNPRSALRKDGTGVGSMVRDAKGLALDLRQLLKRKDPADRQVEFQREALRRAYLQIIFAQPNASNALKSQSTAATSTSIGHMTTATGLVSTHSTKALEALGQMWLDTTHALIHLYRAKLTDMDKQIAEAPQAHRKSRSATNADNATSHPPGPTARRKLIHAFRVFLNQEEEFYRVLLTRLAANLYPSDADGLRPLGINVEVETDATEQQVQADEERSKQRKRALPLAHKALIFFGDLARYRELYSEPSSKSNNSRRGGKQKQHEQQEKDKKAKNWTRAAECYHQARLLMPDDGNPSNQLAVLAQYSSDTLSSTYHYYRALSVMSPFSTARANLKHVYSRAVSRWFAPDGGEPEGDEGTKFKAAFVALHGLFFCKQRLPDLEGLSLYTQDLFRRSVEGRLLPSETIVKVVMTSLCALWNARTFRPARSGSGSEAADVNLEPHLLNHVLSFHQILLTVGQTEVFELWTANQESLSQHQTDGIVDGMGSSLAQLISAVFRRTLPALRILSKWLMGQLEYIERVQQRLEHRERKRNTQQATQHSSDEQDAQDPDSAVDESLDTEFISSTTLRAQLESFWHSFADFNNAIKIAFPLHELPSAREDGVWLEEDVDLLGFAPLRRSTKDTNLRMTDGISTEAARVGKSVHPNDEQLMRIAELQADALLVADAETSLVILDRNAFIFAPHMDEPTPESLEAHEVALATEQIAQAFNGQQRNHQNVSPSKVLRVGHMTFEDVFDEDEDEAGGELGEELTEDDPVDLAMRIGEADQVSLGGEDGSEEDYGDDQIVYDPTLRDASRVQSGLSRMMRPDSGPPSLAHSPASRHALWPNGGAADARQAFESQPNVTHGHQPTATRHAGLVGPAPSAANTPLAATMMSAPDVLRSLTDTPHAFGTGPMAMGTSPSKATTTGTPLGTSPLSMRHLSPQTPVGVGNSRPGNTSRYSDLSASALEFVSRSPQQQTKFLGGPARDSVHGHEMNG